MSRETTVAKLASSGPALRASGSSLCLMNGTGGGDHRPPQQQRYTFKANESNRQPTSHQILGGIPSDVGSASHRPPTATDPTVGDQGARHDAAWLETPGTVLTSRAAPPPTAPPAPPALFCIFANMTWDN